jgi:thiamine kinase-like enzyme
LKGPFNSEHDFNMALIGAYQQSAPKRHIKSFLHGMLPQSHQICFTHGDLRQQNIMVKDGNVVAIIDWELSGWYPEYWEFTKALLIWGWQNDWTDYLMQILQPYHAEHFMHSFLMEKLLI